MADIQSAEPIVALHGITRSFGPVQALRGVDLVVRGGECLGLVGHNGAGKSTLMNVLSGMVRCDAGTYLIAGLPHTGVKAPFAQGISCVSQEIILAPNLTVTETARILHRDLTGFGWRARGGRLMTRMLDEIFPGHGIRPNDLLGDLPINQRQMVEIARAFATSNIRVMILDEPTSSLDGTSSEQLLTYVEERRRGGMAIVLITHLLGEILAVATRVVVMRDGRVVMDQPATGLTRGDLVEAMGHVTVDPQDGASVAMDAAPHTGEVETVLLAPACRSDAVAVRAAAGEVIGLAGLAGRGQTEFLHAIMSGRGVVRATHGQRRTVAFVAGDRKTDGVFPVWSIKENLSIRALSALCRFGLIIPARERRLAEQWRNRIGIRAPTVETKLVVTASPWMPLPTLARRKLFC